MADLSRNVPSLGALNKKTGEYTCPKLANKKEEYCCPECGKDLIVCQGEIRAHHFRHIVDEKAPCHYYTRPSEAQIHKDAKMLLKQLLDKKMPIAIVRMCPSCKEGEEHEIPEITESSSIKLEYRFQYNGGPKIADVAYIDNKDMICIFEIFNTHRTAAENRPEPWFEIHANTLINTVNDSSVSTIRINCVRTVRCDSCVELEKNRVKREKIAKLKQELSDCSGTRTGQGDRQQDSSDDADMYRFMRNSKQDSNYKHSILSQITLIENDITFTLGNNVATMEHPFTKTKIRQSFVNKKTYHNGKWTNKIPFELLVAWFRSSDIETAKSFEHMISNL